MEETRSRKRKHAAITSVLHFWQATIHCSVTLAFLMCVISNVASNACSISAGEDTMFGLYFEVMEQLDNDEYNMLMHPGRGHDRFGISADNNPLPKMNVCRFYKMIPPLFQLYCGLSPTEFDALLAR